MRFAVSFMDWDIFLDAPSHLYKRSCPSVRRSVCPVLFSMMKISHTRRRVSGLVRCNYASLWEVGPSVPCYFWTTIIALLSSFFLFSFFFSFFFFILWYLDSTTHLYKRLCPWVGPSICSSIYTSIWCYFWTMKKAFWGFKVIKRHQKQWYVEWQRIGCIWCTPAVLFPTKRLFRCVHASL